MTHLQLICLPPRINNHCQRLFSWHNDPEAIAVDAFAQPWPNAGLYAFPAFSVIGKLIQKMWLEDTELTLIAQMWPTQHWFATVLQHCMGHPVLLPAKQQHHSPSAGAKQETTVKAEALSDSLSLLQKASRIKEFQATLTNSSLLHGETARCASIGYIGENCCHLP